MCTQAHALGQSLMTRDVGEKEEEALMLIDYLGYACTILVL